ELGVLTQDRFTGCRYPFHHDFQLAASAPVLMGLDLPVQDRSHLAGVLSRDRIRVVPKVDAVHVAIVEPEPDVMRMIYALSGPGFQGKPAGHNCAAGRPQGVKNRFLEAAARIDVSGERLSIDKDIDAVLCLVWHDPHLIRLLYLPADQCGLSQS